MHRKITDVYPEFAQALISGLTNQRENALARSVPELVIVEPCGCGGEGCHSFYTQPPPTNGFGPRHRNVLISPAKGMIVLDVVGAQIHFVEVLD